MAANWVVYNMMSSVTWSYCVYLHDDRRRREASRDRHGDAALGHAGRRRGLRVVHLTALADVVNSGMVSMIVLTGIVCWGSVFYWVYRLNRLNHEAAGEGGSATIGSSS